MFQYKCLNPISEVGLSIFDENYKEVDELNDADAVLVRSAAMHDMQDVPNLLAVARAGAGVNNIPVNDYAEKGIVVFNTPGANANGVKEMVIAGMLLSSRDLIGGNRWVEENKNNPDITKAMEKAKKAFAGTEIQKKKIGVIGLGAIGVLVANVARNLGMDVYGYDPYLSLKSAWNLSRSVHHVNSVDEIFEHCDFISVHVPLMDTTRNMVGREGIAKMKPTATILNFARNGLVDEDAVAEALQEGRLRHYVTDFPTPKVAAVDGVIAFPHLGASTEESEENCAVMAVEQVMDYLENGNIRNSVNFPNIDMGVCQTQGRIAILHRNIPNMLTRFTGMFSKDGINITEMSNKTKDNYSYAIFDLDSPIEEEAVNELKAIDGVLKVRVIK
ncbi:MAG TPA: phosphoglycerate dehydrogenase [Candidatus Anaerobutyricum stercoris]|uniref:D-3-phosphoglycerate dehydrogenase n=1 Tax=Candidatus Anaerobutyricum stercoris TaxID=2838457 RepID=A0A9D2ENB6_9FIRM|nr:phosphoglycerate dehydrogenase [Eubacterium sp. An3]OUO28563.1 3-phosphoglycerate dehydrogenase [Eubacterium sp. An3]CVI73042.1 D-3-phosphoglycerate dehydrogenase [Eubacteriaceae bacterium CHKCI004]HIZ40555.1 phosphoglycerate dehydrogenase [Candidatus Anaerobutyricum stercoris]